MMRRTEPRESAQVSALLNRYGPIMGASRLLRCRHCLKMNYGESPEASRKTQERVRAAKDKAARVVPF